MGVLGSLQRVAATQLVSLTSLQRGFAAMSPEVVTGLNTLKGGADPPLKPDAELPDWLWELAAPPKTLNELKRSQEDALSSADLERLVKLDNRHGIKVRNDDRSK